MSSRQVSTVGITSLGIDHTNLLGNTIEEIAWQKAGIMKPGSIAFTVAQQPIGALEVLKQRAAEKKVRDFWGKKEVYKFRIIIIIFINCIWVVTRWHCLFYMYTNMKLVTNKFNSGGLHEKHVVATWNHIHIHITHMFSPQPFTSHHFTTHKKLFP